MGVEFEVVLYANDPQLAETALTKAQSRIAALDKALQLDPHYVDALSYLSLLYQEKAKALAAVERNAQANDAFAKADEYEKRAIDIRRSRTAGANAK
jgi:tetratricopeptide (TPR) repeat protein